MLRSGGLVQGTHAYPYRYYVWAYDADDLAAVKAGQQQPWDVHPVRRLVALAADRQRQHAPARRHLRSSHQRLFVSQAYGDNEYPVIHVFTRSGAVRLSPASSSIRLQPMVTKEIHETLVVVLSHAEDDPERLVAAACGGQPPCHQGPDVGARQITIHVRLVHDLPE